MRNLVKKKLLLEKRKRKGKKTGHGWTIANFSQQKIIRLLFPQASSRHNE